MTTVALCIDRQSLHHPELLGLGGESLVAQPWLKTFTSAEDIRNYLMKDSSVQEVWVLSSDDVAPINVAATLKSDHPSKRVCLAVSEENGSLRSRMGAAAIDEAFGRRELAFRYAQRKNEYLMRFSAFDSFAPAGVAGHHANPAMMVHETQTVAMAEPLGSRVPLGSQAPLESQAPLRSQAVEMMPAAHMPARGKGDFSACQVASAAANDLINGAYDFCDEWSRQEMLGVPQQGAFPPAAQQRADGFASARRSSAPLQEPPGIPAGRSSAPPQGAQGVPTDPRQALPHSVVPHSTEPYPAVPCQASMSLSKTPYRRPESASVQPQGQRNCFLVSIVSGSGGAGKSTVALLCAYLAQARGLNTLLLDFDLQFGDIARLAGQPDAMNMEDLLAAPSQIEKLSSQGKRPAILAAPQHLENAEALSERAGVLIEMLSPRFDVIVANTGAAWAEQHAVLLERSSKVLFLLDQRASSLRACQHALDFCARCGIATTPFQFLVNKSGKGALLSGLDASCALKGALVGELKDGGRDVEECLGAGVPDDLLSSKNELCLSIEKLLDTILPEGLGKKVAVSDSEDGRSAARKKRRFGRKRV